MTATAPGGLLTTRGRATLLATKQAGLSYPRWRRCEVPDRIPDPTDTGSPGSDRPASEVFHTPSSRAKCASLPGGVQEQERKMRKPYEGKHRAKWKKPSYPQAGPVTVRFGSSVRVDPPLPPTQDAEGHPVDNRPSHDQLYLAERIEDAWGKNLGIPAIQRLNTRFGRVAVTDAMRSLHGFPPEDVTSPYAYIAEVCRANVLTPAQHRAYEDGSWLGDVPDPEDGVDGFTGEPV